MASTKSSKTYEVFYGKRKGFYSLLEDCRDQIRDDENLFYKSFLSRRDAESSWMKYWAFESMKRTWVHSRDYPIMPLLCKSRVHLHRQCDVGKESSTSGKVSAGILECMDSMLGSNMICMCCSVCYVGYLCFNVVVPFDLH